MLLEGKAALVIGASGGIGQAVAAELAAEGADVALHYCTNGTAAQAATMAVQAAGRRAVVLQADVTDPVAVERMVKAAAAQLGRLDILVNGAATRERTEAEYFQPDVWDRVMAVNLKGPYLAALAARPHLAAARGVIVNISSQSAYSARGAYGVSKAALNRLTIWLAREFAPEIRAVGIAPGIVAGGMNRDTSPNRLAEVAARLATGRPGTPREVARFVVYLAADDAGWITGETLAMGGGYMRI